MLRWSQRARADLKAIHAYIAKDSPRNAAAIVREVLARAERVIVLTVVHNRRMPAPEQLRG